MTCMFFGKKKYLLSHKKKASEKVKATFIFEKLDMLKGSHILTEILNERDELNFTNL